MRDADSERTETYTTYDEVSEQESATKQMGSFCASYSWVMICFTDSASPSRAENCSASRSV